MDEQHAVVKDTEKYDWVRLTSGEWLKGEITAYYDKQLEFESDVLDTLMIDRDDIYMVISGRNHAVRFNDGTVLEGPLNISGGYVMVGMGRPDQYKYSDLVSVAPTADSALSAWSIKVGIGANISKGNTEQTEYSASVDIKRRTTTNRLLINALADRTTNDSEITENNMRASGTFDWFYTQSLYFRPISFDYFRDPFQNIAHKYTIGAGIGYYIIVHFVGSSLVLIIILYALFNQQFMLLWLLPIVGYGFAWVGHFFFEKNRPATFKYPFYSLWGDWVMFKDMLVGKIKW